MDWKSIVIEVVSAVLAAVAAWVLAKVRAWLAAKVKTEKAHKLLDTAITAVASAVKATYQVYVESIKGTDAWTAAAQKQALQAAADTAKTQMSAEVQTYIAENFGDVETWLKTQIESTLYDLKN